MSEEPDTHPNAGPEGYLKREGCLVAWPLATPPHSFGEWCLLTPIEQVTANGLRTTLVWKRALMPYEVAEIQSKITNYFGVKLRDGPWALVRGRRQHKSAEVALVTRVSESVDPLRRTGV